MSLDYCVEHYDEKYPHLHFWFTPGDEQLTENTWYLGQHANPKLKEKTFLRQQFFENVGHKYVDKLEKEPDKRIPRERSRYRAAQDRLPPGEPESKAPTSNNDSPNKMFGIPVRESSSNDAPTHNASPNSIEYLPHFQSTVTRLLSIMLDQRRRVGLMSEMEIIDMMLSRSLIQSDVATKIKEAVLNQKQSDEERELHQHQHPERGISDNSSSSLGQSNTLANLARGKKYEPPSR